MKGMRKETRRENRSETETKMGKKTKKMKET